MESNENIIIKAFITKCTAHVKYKYYANKCVEEGLIAVGEQIDEFAQNELYHAFALLRRLGFDENTEVNLTDMVEGEKQDVEVLRKLVSTNYDIADVLDLIIKIDEGHLKKAEELLMDMKNDNAYKIKRCTLCGFLDKSASLKNPCPRCGHNYKL